MIDEVASPCVTICSVNDAGDCIGCGRSLDEIAAWRLATNDERQAILARAANRLAKADPTSLTS